MEINDDNIIGKLEACSFSPSIPCDREKESPFRKSRSQASVVIGTHGIVLIASCVWLVCASKCLKITSGEMSRGISKRNVRLPTCLIYLCTLT